MIKIECQCKESFRISEQNMINKTEVKCPNCDQQMSEEISKSLISYANLKLESDKEFAKAKTLSIEKPPGKEMWGGIAHWLLSVED